MRLPDKRCIVLDMDGTIYMGDNPIKGAVAFVQRHWEDVDFFFLSNNTSKAPETYIKKLNGMGIPARREQLLSPVTPLVAFLKAEGIHTAYVVGNRDFVSDLRQRMPELKQQEKGAQAVILAYDTELTYEKLARSALLLPVMVPPVNSNLLLLYTPPPQAGDRNASSASRMRPCFPACCSAMRRKTC